MEARKARLGGMEGGVEWGMDGGREGGCNVVSAAGKKRHTVDACDYPRATERKRTLVSC